MLCTKQQSNSKVQLIEIDRETMMMMRLIGANQNCRIIVFIYIIIVVGYDTQCELSIYYYERRSMIVAAAVINIAILDYFYYYLISFMVLFLLFVR